MYPRSGDHEQARPACEERKSGDRPSVNPTPSSVDGVFGAGAENSWPEELNMDDYNTNNKPKNETANSYSSCDIPNEETHDASMSW